MVSQETGTKTTNHGENNSMTITHGILLTHGTFDNLIHELEEITANDDRKVNKKVNWKKTRVFDNSNKGRYQNLSIYRERWR